MILDIYKDALEYPTKNIENILKLGLITFCCILIFPIFFVLGYSYRITKIAVNGMINGEDAHPNFNELGDLFKSGIKVFVVQLVNLIIPIILIALSQHCIKWIPGNTGYAVSIILFIAGIILGIFGYLYYYAGIAHMAKTDDTLKSAFDYEKLTEIIKSVGFFKFFVYFLGIDIILIVLSVIVILALIILFLVLGFGTAFFLPFIGLGLISFGTIITMLIYLFVVAPYVIMVKGRTIGLIYNLH